MSRSSGRRRADVFPSSQRSIQSCPAGQLHNSKEVGRTKTKDLSSYFLERGGAPLRKCREATEAAQTGWSDRQALDFPGLLLRLRPIGLALRATSARQFLLSC